MPYPSTSSPRPAAVLTANPLDLIRSSDGGTTFQPTDAS